MTVVQGDLRRRFEQWAHNPRCEANTLSVALNVRMSEVARSAGVEHDFGQSPFALARGVTFERSLLQDDAARLREALVRRDVLDEWASGFLDLRTRQSGGPMADLESAAAATTTLLEELADGAGEPTIIAAATLVPPSTSVGTASYLIIDALVARPSEDGRTTELVVGEVKTYPDRGGYTDRQSLAGARAQAGLYVHVLGLTVAAMGLADRLSVALEGFLVLSRPGSSFPSVRAGEDLRHQAERARRGLELLEAAAAGALALVSDDDDAVDAIRAARTAYAEECLAFCEMAANCHALARQADDPIVLGDDVRRFLAGVTLERALALLDGATPETDTEADLVLRAHGLARATA